MPVVGELGAAPLREVRIAQDVGRGVTLLRPRSYMNLSGGPVLAQMTRQAAKPGDLPPGLVPLPEDG